MTRFQAERSLPPPDEDGIPVKSHQRIALFGNVVLWLAIAAIGFEIFRP
jgi:hypothetical protein